MKKILYIIPIVVFAMVGLTQDAKAQSGQTGNASNAITQGATNAVTAAALLTTSTGSDNSTTNGGSTVTNVVSVQAQTPSVQTTIRLSIDVTMIESPSIKSNIIQSISRSLYVLPSRIQIYSISAG